MYFSVPPPEAPKAAAAPAPAAPTKPPPPTPTPGVGGASGYVDIEVTSMRRTIAKRLTQSKVIKQHKLLFIHFQSICGTILLHINTGQPVKQFSTLQGTIAHSYASIECQMNNLLELRKDFKAEGVNVSVNDLIIKSVAVALSRCPEMNCVWQGDQVRHCIIHEPSSSVKHDNTLTDDSLREGNVRRNIACVDPLSLIFHVVAEGWWAGGHQCCSGHPSGPHHPNSARSRH